VKPSLFTSNRSTGKIDHASRFLYTLHEQGALRRGSELRAKVLYELFRLTFNAGANHTPLTAGDLKFYQDVATADPHPGMLGGALSLILADSNPQYKFELEEVTATEHFNIAAAYRLFNAYKSEYPTSPEMAQMYLDLIRHYSTTSEANVAAELLAEFEKRYSDAPKYAEVVLKLADCYINYGMYDEERALYQRVMDRLGKRRKKDKPLMPVWETGGIDELTSHRPAVISYPPSDYREGEDNDGYSRVTRFNPVPLKARKNSDEESVSYAFVLSRYVASLARENRTADILALYSNEIKKYPDEQGLYEQMLQWLGQTNLVEEQLRVYQEAIKRFPTELWTDRLARWYLRRNRKQQFEQLSRELLEKMNDSEIESYFAKFVTTGVSNYAPAFESGLYLSLYTRAHERFPHNPKFVEGLLDYYAGHKLWSEYQRLLAEYYFESKPLRERYLMYLASNNKLREYAGIAREKVTKDVTAKESLTYKLFRADAAAWLSNYEEAVDAYRELNQLYPNTPEFAGRLVAFTRSFGQKDQQSLAESAKVQGAMADASPSSESYRTQAGEIYAELGDYRRAGEQWGQLIRLGEGDPNVYLDVATVYWDYFQYDDALRVLMAMRRQMNDHTLYAFQVAAILEAKHQSAEAIAEYVKALDQNCEDYWRAQRRLKTLYSRKNVPQQLRAAFQRELARAKDRESLVLGYVRLLEDVGKWDEASALLKREVALSRTQDFLEEARGLLSGHEDAEGERACLRRLTVAAKTFRFAISYQLQLVESVASSGQKDSAAAMLAALVNRFPTNYGVLSEAVDFNWRIGKRESAIRLLAKAADRGRGRFHYIFTRKLAARQIERGQLASAERSLKRLNDENPRNLDVFNELARIYVRTSRPDALRERYRETIRTIKQSDMDRYQMRDLIEQLRSDVIESFTQLKDYQSAVEQHIEIINRDPDDEEKVEAAIRYVKRYGGAEALISYYTKTSEQAYKDYRWNLVLARLYEAKGDWANAIGNLRKAIINQPEMVELHSELADVCLKAKDYRSAIDALNRARELTNDDPQYLKRLVDAYEKAGSKREAETVRAKLPVEKPKTKTLAEQFSEAAALGRSEQAKAIEAYRKAFGAFASNFYKHELRSHELAGYVETVRDEEPLDQILRRLWDVRERIRQDAASGDNLLAGKARALLETFDRALPEAVGRIASEYATGNELAAIDRDVRSWVAKARSATDGEATLAVLLNLSQRAALGQLAEEILLARKDAAFALGYWSSYHDRLMSLVNFYSERGAYQRVVEFLNQERARDSQRDKFNYRSMIAEYARLIGDRESELKVLREEFASNTGKPPDSTNALVERYFEALLENGEAGRNELQQCIQQPTPFRFQLINFLLRNNEVNLARDAIDAAPLSTAWKSSRQAELSVAAGDLNRDNEAFFLRAMNWKTIGETIANRPDGLQQLVGDNWFHIAEGYGRWVALSEKTKQPSKASSAMFLPAMIESRPRDANEQRRLASWYSEQGQHEMALEHLQLALEMMPGDLQTIADIGSAYFKMDNRQQADEYWAKIIASDDPKAELKIENCDLYLRTLARHGLAAEARTKLQPYVVKRLVSINRNSSRYDNRSDEEMESLKPFIRTLTKSFGKESDDGEVVTSPKDEAEKAAFLRGLCESVTGDVMLAEMAVREPLVKREYLAPFYEMLVRRTQGISSYESDSDFVDRLQTRRAWSVDEIEESLDHEAWTQSDTQTNAESSPQFGPRITWQQEYLDYLIAQRRTTEANNLVLNIEREFRGRYPRPAWLRLAKLRLEVRSGRVAQAMNGLKHFTGIEVTPKLDRIAPPNIEWLNQAVAVLRSEKRNAEADELLKAAYERTLALEQLQPPPFIALARLAFERGDAERGLKLIGLMVELGNTETRETAAAELASLTWVKARATDAEWVERPQQCNQIREAEALQAAAETATVFGQFATAIDFRQRLSAIAPDDNANKLELARTLAESGKIDDAMNLLASLISDRRTPRQIRWTALWIAPEIVTQERWPSFEQQAGAGKDIEMLTAIEAQLLSSRGQVNEAINRLNDAVVTSPSAQLRLLRALLQKNAGQERESLQSLLASMIACGDAWIAAPFNATEDEQRWQLFRLYAKHGQPRAALKLASVDERLKGQSSSQPSTDGSGDAERIDKANPGLSSLSARASHRQKQSQIELLALLSVAAEQTGEFGKAIEFENARLNLSLDSTRRRTSESRIAQLRVKQKERMRKPPVPLVINENPATI
jgi:tetratricopeptide (TPR) repeat protein